MQEPLNSSETSFLMPLLQYVSVGPALLVKIIERVMSVRDNARLHIALVGVFE